MQKFLLLLHEDTKAMQDLSPKDMEALVNAHMNWAKKLSKAGQMLAGDALKNEGKLIKGKESVIKDGHYMESKEILGGFYLLLAKDMETALEISKECPCHLWGGTTEVRPIAVYE